MKLSNYTVHISRNFFLAYPVMLSMLGQVMTGVADSIMVGWLGATPLAAVSLGHAVFMLLMTFGIGVTYAITPLVAEADGSHSDQRINDLLRHGFVINMVTGLLLVAFVFSSQQLMFHIGQPEEVVKLAIPYLDIVTVSLIPTMLFQTFRQFAEGLSRTRMAMIIVVGSNVLNILLNYVLIYGKLGFPELGLNGAGWATLISRVVMGFFMAGYVYFDSSYRKYRNGFSIGNYSRAMISKMLHIGIPSGVQFIFEVSAFGFSAIMMGWLGTTALASHQIAINLATISYMTTSGLGAAATIRVGNFLGKKEIQTMRDIAFSLFGMATVIMVGWGVLFIVGRDFLPTLYIDDPNVIAAASSLLIIAGFFQMSDGLQVVCVGALRGLQDVKIPSVLILISYWVIALPLGYWLAFPLGYGAKGIWLGLLIGLSLTAIAMIVRFNRLSRKLMP